MKPARDHGVAPVSLLLWVIVAAVLLSASAEALVGGAHPGPAAREAPTPLPGDAGRTPAALTPDSTPLLPAVIASVPVGSEPVSGAADLANGFVYVANSISDNVSVLNGTAVVGSVSLTANLSGDPLYVVYDGLNGFVYVVDRYNGESSFGGGAVSVLVGTTVLATIAVGVDPTSAVLDPSNGYLYVTNAGGSNVTVVQGTGAIANVTVGSGPCAAAYDPFDGYVYVANRGSANVSVLFATHLVGSLPAGNGPESIAYNPDNGYVYAVNSGSDNATVYDDILIAGNVPVGDDPVFVAFVAQVGGMEVTNAGSSTVTVVNSTAVVATLPVAADPVWLGDGPFGGLTFVVGEGAGAVTVLLGTIVLGNVSVGSLPTYGVDDPVTHLEYVTNSGSNDVSVLAAAYPVSFNETGLVPGVNWSVTLANSTVASTSPSIAFAEPNGSYAYAVGTPPGYLLLSATPGSPVLVNGSAVVVNVTFAPKPSGTYALTFVETGLAKNCTSGGGGWKPAVGSDCCRSSSLPAWTVSVNGVSQTTTNSSLTFLEPSGTYNYTVYPPSGYIVASSTPGSPVTIDGANLTVNVTFAKAPCAHPLFLTFEETGLPWGTVWCVTVNGTQCSAGRSISFGALPPGTYAFNVSTVRGFTAQPASGTVTLTDRGVTVWVRFASTGHPCGG